MTVNDAENVLWMRELEEPLGSRHAVDLEIDEERDPRERNRQNLSAQYWPSTKETVQE